MINSGCFGHVCPPWFAPQFLMVSSTNVEAVAANNVALQQYGQKEVYGHVLTNSGKRIFIQITFDVMNVRKFLLSTSALKHRGVTIIFDHDYDGIIFRNETVNLVSHDCHSHLRITLPNEIPSHRALVMVGVDEEVYGNDGAERNEAQEASAGDRRAIADAVQAGQLGISGEAKTARIQRTPEPPTDAARMAHNASHAPPRDWCPICVASRGRSSPHRRVVVNKTADTLPKFQTDNMFIRTVAESKTQPCITFVETRSGVVISFLCVRKGGYEDLTKEILRHFEAYGFVNPVIIQCDKEMNIIDVCRKKLHANETREQCYDLRQKQVIRTTVFVESNTRTHSGTRTMLPDTNRDEHWHTAFSNLTCHSISNALRWICSRKIHSATRRQNPNPIFARNSICISFVHVW